MTFESKLQQLAELNDKIDTTVPARKRISMLYDEESFVELDMYIGKDENLSGVVTGYGLIEGAPAYVFSQDVSVAGGAVGVLEAQKICKIYDLATKTGTPVVGIFDSNGMRLDEGVHSLAAFGEVLMKSNILSGVVPQISVVLGTCAGSATMVACSGDIVIMSKEAKFFMVPPYTENVKGRALEGAGTLKNAMQSGIVHVAVDDDQEAMDKVREIVSLLPLNNLSEIPGQEFSESENAQELIDEENIASAVADADSLVPLQLEYGKCAFTAIGRIAGSTVGFIVAGRNSQKLCGDGADKISRFVRFCDAFNIPIITFVDTVGFEASSKEELNGSIRSLTKMSGAYSEATTVKISVITGKAYGPAYNALAGKTVNADVVLAWPNAEISALEPLTSIAILYRDQFTNTKEDQLLQNKLLEKYNEEYSSAFAVAKTGNIDHIIEPLQTREFLIHILEMCAGKRVSGLPKKHVNIPF